MNTTTVTFKEMDKMTPEQLAALEALPGWNDFVAQGEKAASEEGITENNAFDAGEAAGTEYLKIDFQSDFDDLFIPNVRVKEGQAVLDFWDKVFLKEWEPSLEAPYSDEGLAEASYAGYYSPIIPVQHRPIPPVL